MSPTTLLLQPVLKSKLAGLKTEKLGDSPCDSMIMIMMADDDVKMTQIGIQLPFACVCPHKSLVNVSKHIYQGSCTANKHTIVNFSSAFMRRNLGGTTTQALSLRLSCACSTVYGYRPVLATTATALDSGVWTDQQYRCRAKKARHRYYYYYQA